MKKIRIGLVLLITIGILFSGCLQSAEEKELKKEMKELEEMYGGEKIEVKVPKEEDISISASGLVKRIDANTYSVVVAVVVKAKKDRQGTLYINAIKEGEPLLKLALWDVWEKRDKIVRHDIAVEFDLKKDQILKKTVEVGYTGTSLLSEKPDYVEIKVDF